ncbi:MAG: hypothetical protein CVU70_01260 [Deltaproteobacteria bacterium HGW-Deltaproteobacteria-5]|nr:MAG: hypothetical protein CVU70_01260 [Deltaproteobacteria bacterium HGW-Deltaproteobacteria-5]
MCALSLRHEDFLDIQNRVFYINKDLRSVCRSARFVTGLWPFRTNGQPAYDRSGMQTAFLNAKKRK